jgi:hypothetical protein
VFLPFFHPSSRRVGCELTCTSFLLAGQVTLSFDETKNLEDVDELFSIFAGGKEVSASFPGRLPQPQSVAQLLPRPSN